MTLLTYNVLYDDAVRWGAEYAWERRRPGIAALLKQHPADLLGFQELKAGPLADVGRMLGAGYGAINPFESERLVNTQTGTRVDRATGQVGKLAIDHVFVRNVARVESYAILPDRFDERYPSDHLPVKVVLSL